MRDLNDIKNGLLFTVALVALVMATQPLGLMSTSSQVIAACVVFACLSILSVLVLRDKPRDERESKLSSDSEKIGFIAGVLIAGGGVLWSAIWSTNNTLLEVTLAIMVISKLVSNWYFRSVK